MDWSILGIEPTKDKKAITAAYRKQLVQVHPEEKPEEFKALRAAYEEALRLAEESDHALVRDESPVGLWMEQVRSLYQDFARRIQPENWQMLLELPVCRELDTRAEAEDALLRFLMEDYHLPQAVWQALDGHFHFSDRVEELYDNYPRDFIDHAVMPGIRRRPNLPYDLYTPGTNAKNCDELHRLYHRALSVPPQEHGEILEQMAQLSESHPYCEMLSLLYQANTGDADSARAGLSALAQQFPMDATVNLAFLSQCPGEWELIEETARRILDVEPDNRPLRLHLAEALAHREEYDDAKEIIFALLRESGGDQVQASHLQDRLKRWNQDIIRHSEQALADDPTDSATARKLAWCYLQNDDLQNAFRVSELVDEDKETDFDYHNLMAKIAFAREEWAIAMPHLERLVFILRQAQNDPEHHAHKHADRLPEFLQITGSCMISLKLEDKGLALFEEALTLAPNDPTILNHMGRLLYFRREYARSIEYYQRLTEIMPGSYHGYLMLAMGLYELGRDAEAFDAVNRALDLEGSDLMAYVTRMRILLRNSAWDQVQEMLDFLEQAGVGDEVNVCWCRAQLLDLSKRDRKAAKAIYDDIAKRMKQGESIFWEADVYYHIAVLSTNTEVMDEVPDTDAVLAILDQGLAADPKHEDCLNYKAWLLSRAGRKAEALAIYQTLEAIEGHSLNAEYGLAQLYYNDLSQYADKALHYYKILIQQQPRPTPDFLFYAGTCARYLNKLDAAQAYFLREQELEPDDLDGYNGLAHVYEAMGRYEDALEQVNKAIACATGHESRYAWLFDHKAQILRRMGRVQEAIDLLSEAINLHGVDCFATRFETCCQFGRWGQAKTTLDHWIQVVGKTDQNAEAAVKLPLYQGKLMKSTLAFAANVKHLDRDTQDDLKVLVADLEGNPQRGLRVWSQRCRADCEETYALGYLSLYQWVCGEHAEAQQTARKLLTLIDRKIAGFTVDEALLRTSRVRPLAILGRYDEARAELEKARAIPLCSHCVYGSCKDADIFEAELEEIRGNRENALILYRKGAEKWPDETDFAAGIARLSKKKG